MTHLLLILAFVTLAQLDGFCCNIEYGSFYMWPKGYIDHNRDTIYYLWTFGYNKTDGSLEKNMNVTGLKTKAPTKVLREYSYKAFNAHIEMYRITVQTSSINDYLNKIRSNEKIEIEMFGETVPALCPHISYMSYDLFSAHGVCVDACSQSRAVQHETVPCDAHKFSLENLCLTEWICENRISDKLRHRDIPNIKIGQSPYFSDAKLQSGEQCFPILTFESSHECLIVNEKLSWSQSRRENYCEIYSSSKNKDGDVVITVPGKRGEKVCADYWFDNSVYQRCSVVIEKYAKVTVPESANKVFISCSETGKKYSKETKIKCPKTPYAFGDTICKNAKSPIILWIAIIWIFLGLPIIFVCAWFFMILNRWWIFRQIKAQDQCKNCCQWYNNLLEMKLHDRCEFCLCPYCGEHQLNKKILISHAMKCSEKNTTVMKVDEVIKYKWHMLSSKIDASLLYSARFSKIVWILIFICLFSVSFASRDHHNRIRHMKFRDHGEINPEALPRPPIMKDESLDDDELMYVGKELVVQPEIVNGKLNSIGAAIGDIRTSLNDLTTSMISRFELIEYLKHLQFNLSESTRDALKHAIIESEERQVCSTIWSKINLNTLYPEWKMEKGYDEIRVHKDDTSKVFAFQQKINYNLCGTLEEGGDGSKVIRTVHAAENAAVANAGRADIQITIGGGGSRPEIALGSSHQNKLNLDDQAKQEAIDQATREELDTFSAMMSPKRRQWEKIGEKLRTKRDVSSDEIDMILAEKKVNIDKISHSMKQNTPIWLNFREVDIENNDGKKMKTKISKFSENNPVTGKNKRNKFIDHHIEWDRFEKNTKNCKVQCLHLPNSCTCITSNIPEDGKVIVPWAIINIFDEKPFRSKLSFSQEIATKTSEDENSIKGRSYVSGQLELREGNSVGWEVSIEGSPEKHTITLAILKIATIYRTKFLYYTCERTIETEVKSYCTGGCGDYCGGRVCLGSEIWKWQNCRSWSCNPPWCWAIGDGCCCCGVNVHCKDSKYILALWEVEPIRTEFVMCLYHNDRAFHCQKIDETTEYEIDNFKIGISRANPEKFSHPNHIATLSQVIKKDKSITVSEATEAYFNPNLCHSSSLCNHGSVGDLQVNEYECLFKLGVQCADNHNKLAEMGCTDKVYLTESGSQMTMSCHRGDYHSCNHHHAKKHVSFEAIRNSDEIHNFFIEKKMQIDLKKKEFRLALTSKESSGDINFQLTVDDLSFKKDHYDPVIKSFKLETCEGCFSCSSGFSCKAKIETDSPEPFLVTLSTETDRANIGQHSIQIRPPSSSFDLWGYSHTDLDSMQVCASFGNKKLSCTKTVMKLHEPAGEYIPVFEDNVGMPPSDNNKCIGLSWFKCSWQSVSGFFIDIWSWAKKSVWIILAITIGLILIILLPYIIKFSVGTLKLCNCFRKKKPLKLPSRKDLLVLANQVRQSNDEYGKSKKDEEAGLYEELHPFVSDIYPNEV